MSAKPTESKEYPTKPPHGITMSMYGYVPDNAQMINVAKGLAQLPNVIQQQPAGMQPQPQFSGNRSAFSGQ